MIISFEYIESYLVCSMTFKKNSNQVNPKFICLILLLIGPFKKFMTTNPGHTGQINWIVVSYW